MGLPISFFFHFSPKNEETNGIRRVNYTHAIYLGMDIPYYDPREIFRQSLNIL
jgi:hypothetical protein